MHFIASLQFPSNVFYCVNNILAAVYSFQAMWVYIHAQKFALASVYSFPAMCFIVGVYTCVVIYNYVVCDHHNSDSYNVTNQRTSSFILPMHHRLLVYSHST